jgi:hypothetical protein
MDRQTSPRLRTSLREWRAATARLAAGYCGVVHADHGGYQRTSFLLQSAAELVWRRSTPLAQPCWGRLDVGVWLADLEAAPPWAGPWRATAVATLRGFLTWLVDEGHVPAARLVRVLRRLEEEWS